jgi:hypothetical protein
MTMLRHEQSWKHDEFYAGTDVNVKEWKAAEFSFILKQITEWTIAHFNSIEAILKMENGRELFLKYGYENCVALKNMSKEERPKILEAAEKHRAAKSTAPNFHAVINKLFPKKKNAIPIENGKDAEIKRLKEVIKDLELKLKKLEGENKKLRDMMMEKILKVA